MKTVAIIDYGMGNLHSVAKAVEHVAPEVRVQVTADPAKVRAADRVILPGVGAIRDCMAEMRRLGVDELVREVSRSRPLLGVCVGMQALLERSEENQGVDCIGLFPGSVDFFGHELEEEGVRLKVPHMGWNQVYQDHKQALGRPHPLWHGIEDGERFYFVHSYYVAGSNTATVGHTRYGVDVAAAVARDNVFAVQFHPEKSHRAGLQLLKNFVAWQGEHS